MHAIRGGAKARRLVRAGGSCRAKSSTAGMVCIHLIVTVQCTLGVPNYFHDFYLRGEIQAV